MIFLETIATEFQQKAEQCQEVYSIQIAANRVPFIDITKKKGKTSLSLHNCSKRGYLPIGQNPGWRRMDKSSVSTTSKEKEGNEHFINDYQLYTKSLVISKIEDSKETQHKNLEKIWEYARDKTKFFDYVTNEIKVYLEE